MNFGKVGRAILSISPFKIKVDQKKNKNTGELSLKK